MTRIFHLILLALTLYCWKGFLDRGQEVEALEAQLVQVEDIGDPEDKAAELETEIQSAKGQRLGMGLLLTMFSCGVIGIFIGIYVIPFIAQRATHAIFDSGELVEKDTMREAHSLLAQGEFEGAIEAFRKAANEDPSNRFPWVEMAKVFRHNLHDPASAVAILHEAIEAHEWSVDDVAFLFFRLAEIHNEDLEDRQTARAVMEKVVNDYPETRHSANAAHKLREWDHEEEEAQRRAHEHEFIVQRRAQEDQDPGLHG